MFSKSQGAPIFWKIHNDVEHLEALLSSVAPDRPKIIAFESIYSMDGDITPLAGLCDAAEKYGAMTYLDEVHAVALYGPTGAGLAEREAMAHRVTLIEGTLGKAFGVMGGYIAGPAILIDAVRSLAESFIFTTSLSPHLAVGAISAIRHVKAHPEERQQVAQAATHLKSMLHDAGLPVMDAPGHILPLLIGNASLCQRISQLLLIDHGIYLQPINYPTVPHGQERLRITPTPYHTPAHMQQLVRALLTVAHKLKWRTTSIQN